MKDLRLQIAAIPKYPRGMNFWKAWNDGKGVMTEAERELDEKLLSPSEDF
jgi:DNA (cytosine-5)-methyltransferase 1